MGDINDFHVNNDGSVTIDEQVETKTNSLKDKIVNGNENPKHFKRMPFVTFFLGMLMSFFALSSYVELWFTFGRHFISWFHWDHETWYNRGAEPVCLYEFCYVELIIGILSLINTIAIILIFRGKKSGFWIIASCCSITLCILVLCSQLGIEYNSIGNLVLMKNLIIPFILWTVLNLKNEKGESQWKYLQ